MLLHFIQNKSLLKERPVHLLPSAYTEAYPDIWEATNNWMLENALKESNGNITLIALWDQYGANGAGGTEHRVSKAQHTGAHVLIIDI